VRAGFVQKVIMGTWDQLSQTRPPSLYTFYPTAGFDPGPDGLPGTSDDGGEFGYYDIAPGTALPRNVLRYTDQGDYRYKYPTLDLTFSKRLFNRWSGEFSVSRTFRHTYRNGAPYDDPNETIYEELRDRQWTLKAFATVEAPWGISVSPQVMGQSGASVQREVQVTPRYTSSLNVPVVPRDGKVQAPNVVFMNMQVRKEVRFSGQRLTFIFEGQNLFNSNVATAVSNVTGISQGALLVTGTL
jgi:hypothetical protein